MKQEDKDLLLKDLCARLPYGVKVEVTKKDDWTGKFLPPITKKLNYLMLGGIHAKAKGYIEDEYKPYLFTMSSMTDVQREEWHNTMFKDEYGLLTPLPESFDWLNKNHFDYRGLIKKGIAIDTTGLNIY